MTYRTSLCLPNVGEAVIKTMQRYAHLWHETIAAAAIAADRAVGELLVPLSPSDGAHISLGMGA